MNVIETDELGEVLRSYKLEPLRRIPEAAGGTANANVIVDTDEGRFFLKRRNPKYANQCYAAFDHALMEHLALFDVPTPLARISSDGNRWLTLRGAIYELFPFKEGSLHDKSSNKELRNAGAALARFHGASMSFNRPSGKEWPRYDDVGLICQSVYDLEAEICGRVGPEKWRELKGHVDQLSCIFTERLYHDMPKLVVHGDYHPGNLKFAEGSVAGIFDLDWASYQPKIRDIADGVFLFAGERQTAIDAADITSLTQTWTPSLSRARSFLEGYSSVSTISVPELKALPLFVKARWLSCRLGGMTKVSEDRRLTYFTDGLVEPLNAVDGVEWL
jgi:homoserine kinase type II